MNNAFQQGEIGIHMLHGAVAAAAMHDSAESYPQPKCHPETRTKMLKDLHDWTLDKKAQHRILWVYGPAGAGKSAIMQTFAPQLQDVGSLGGSFFLSGGILLVETGRCCSLQSLHFEGPSADLIDEILRVIRITASHSAIPLRFIAASRPEPHIREVFESPVYADVHRAFNVEQSFDDVRRYLCDEFSRIHREHRTMAHIQLHRQRRVPASHQLYTGRRSQWVQRGPSFPRIQLDSQPGCNL
ncbi:hypothetical protein B0H19DRAFT_1276168 [Mycena capillaripes]|nr:hypothetical protein B0H19DRAFT_1276168 [Mycena capillaripes]